MQLSLMYHARSSSIGGPLGQWFCLSPRLPSSSSSSICSTDLMFRGAPQDGSQPTLRPRSCRLSSFARARSSVAPARGPRLGAARALHPQRAMARRSGRVHYLRRHECDSDRTRRILRARIAPRSLPSVDPRRLATPNRPVFLLPPSLWLRRLARRASSAR